MSRLKLFVQNMVVYGLGGTISKIIPLIMLPIITRLMPDTFYFGLNDLSTVVIAFGQALAVLGMYDAMFRMFFEKEDLEYKKSICSSALGFTMITSLIIFILMFILRKPLSVLFFSSPEYTNLLMLSAISILMGATNSIMSAPTRMNNHRVVYIVTNTLSSVIAYSISIPLLLKGYFVIALPLASAVSAIVIECVFFALNRNWFSIKRINTKYIRQMLIIALPLVPNFLVYWIFSSSDRWMIAKILGNDYAGIYAIGGKIGQVSQLIYTAFAGGWQYFAFSTMRDEDQVQMTSNVFEYLGFVAFSAILLMASLSETIFKLLFTGDYLQGSNITPYLFAAPLLLMLYQVACNQFIVIKKTWPNMMILGMGAICNIALNYILIHTIGIEGAALATVTGYIISIAVGVAVLERMNLLKISFRFYGCVVISIVYMLVWRFAIKENVVISLLAAVFSILCMAAIYYRSLKKLITGKKRYE